MKPEGPFGDHLGYYSLRHPFPVLRVEHVYHRDDPIWAFTVVGRPPQEDTAFRRVDSRSHRPGDPLGSAGRGRRQRGRRRRRSSAVARGRQRSATCRSLDEPRPQEILTQANAILGQGQLSLAKFLFIADVGFVAVARSRRGRVARHRVVPRTRPPTRRLVARSAFLHTDDDRHARLLGRLAQCRLEARRRRRGPAAIRSRYRAARFVQSA